MVLADLLFDGLIALLLVGLAWRLLRVPDLFQAGLLFIVFGLLTSVAWLRLHAPDVALAEAALGAGVTGALFLNTLAGAGEHPEDAGSGSAPSERWLGGAVAGIAAVLTGGLVALLAMGAGQPGLPSPVPPAGGKLANPVTAVLLDVRGYDTLLETAVVWIALLGVAVLGPDSPPPRETAPPVLVGLARVVVPLMILLAGWLLWQGAAATGGAFQAAAVLAAGGILARLAGFPVPPVDSPWLRRWLAAAGTAVFLGVAVALMAAGQLLEYPAGTRGTLALVIEAAVAVAIATILVALFDAVGPRRREAPR